MFISRKQFDIMLDRIADLEEENETLRAEVNRLSVLNGKAGNALYLKRADEAVISFEGEAKARRIAEADNAGLEHKIAVYEDVIKNLSRMIDPYKVVNTVRGDDGKFRSQSGETMRQKEDKALAMSNAGKSIDEIANTLGISIRVAGQYIANAMERNKPPSDPEVIVELVTYSPSRGKYTQQKKVHESDMEGDNLRKDTRWKRVYEERHTG